MSVAAVVAPPRTRPAVVPQPAPFSVEIVVPVYNEERQLARSIRRLHAYVSDQLPFRTLLTIADNASTDATWAIANQLADELSDVRLLHLNEKGRGRALAAAWLTSTADVVAYMDVDLSTGLSALLPLLSAVMSGHSQIAIGSRLARGAQVTRGARRDIISRCYNLLLRLVLRVGFRDAQCGFKAVRGEVARRLLPRVVDRNWFFDTELLVLAERERMRILELPVDWVDDSDSRVQLLATALEDLRGIWRLATSRRDASSTMLGRHLPGFLAVGVASTAAYAALYLLLRGFLPASASNTAALVVTAIANTAANRRLTFGVRGSQRVLRDHAGGLIAFAIALVLTSGSIVALHQLQPVPSVGLEIAVLTAANAVATGARFLILRALFYHLTDHTWRDSR